MDKNEINRFIHELIIGKCWHEWTPGKPKKIYFGRDEDSISTYQCRCGLVVEGYLLINPDYTSSLDAIAQVEKKVIERVKCKGYARIFVDHVQSQFTKEQQDGMTDEEIVVTLCTAPALMRAEAVCKAWEAGK
jgi:hypothetical protein